MDKVMIDKLKQDKLNKFYGVKGNNDLLTVKEVDLSSRTITGLYNAYWWFDSDKDVIVPGAALKSIKERGPDSGAVAKIKHALFHDLTKLPGKLEILDERDVEIGDRTVKGIYFETKMSTTQLGNDTLKNYQEGIYDNHSIGFRYVQLEFLDNEAEDWDFFYNNVINKEDVGDYMWVVKELNLWEGSTVSFGANSLTPYLGSKSGDKDINRIKLLERMDLLNKQLRSGTQSDDMMKTFEIQVLQIKQMITELIPTIEPGIKDTLTEPTRKPTPVKGIDYKFLNTNINK